MEEDLQHPLNGQIITYIAWCKLLPWQYKSALTPGRLHSHQMDVIICF